MKGYTLFLVTLMIAAGLSAQDVKYKKIFYKDQSIENMDVRVTITDAVATPAGLKFRLSIVNKSNDYILFKPTECEFRTKGNNMKPEEKSMLIKPNDKDALTMDMKVVQNMLPDDFKFLMDGFYRISLNGQIVKAENLKIPASVNNFKAGEFSVNMDKIKKETASSWVKFKVSYNGNNIGIIEPTKVTMKMPDGKEYANYNNDKPLIMEKGAMEDFTPGWKDVPISSGDMQKVEMIVQFNSAFKETVPVKLPPLELKVLFDLETSNKSGK